MRRTWLPFRLVRTCSLLLIAAAGAAHAADPQPYAVTLAPTGDSALDAALHDSSSLISLAQTAPAGGFALAARARQDLARFTTVLNSFGYYKAHLTLTIGGHPVDDPAVADTIDAAPAAPPLPVVAKAELGPRFMLGQVTVEGALPPGERGKLDLAPGTPALAVAVLAAQDRLLQALRTDGYPLATVEVPPATVHPDTNQLDVTFLVKTGPQARLGAIAIHGLDAVHEDFVRHRLLLHPGERFDPAQIEKARLDLMQTGVFAVVRITQASQLDAQGALPLTVDVSERPRHAVDAGIAYSTDTGINFNAGWHHRNLFGNAEQLNLTGSVQLGGNAVAKPGYLLGAQFIKPDFLAHDQSLELDLNGIDQSLQAYDQKAVLEKAAINRIFAPHWTASVGLSGEQEAITQEGVERHYDLIGLPMSVKYDSTTSLLDPSSGYRVAVSITPMHALTGNSSTFFISQLAGSSYFDFGTAGRSVLAVRGLVGEISGTGVFGLPPDQRFYGGGSATVRGYRYQSIGPQFADRKPTGGTAVSAGTVEFRQRVFGNYGFAAFVDAGQVSTNGAPFTSQWLVGAGVGFRYYTSIGPLRLDVAVPLNKQPGGDAFELYIGIGQAF